VLFSGAYTVVLVLQSWTDGEGVVFSLLFVPSIASIPISITIAITRYRLFEIDRIISRTLSYAMIVVVLATVFVGVVTLTSSILPSQNSLAVAASTLAVAALFNPLRRKVQRVVDHRFNRAGYNATLVAEEFANRLQNKLEIGEITDDWTNTVNQALQPAFTSAWIRDGESRSTSH
jgi:ABC-type bacteriocin/lantibiotic exporter with double-glycine peptidase domain